MLPYLLLLLIAAVFPFVIYRYEGATAMCSYGYIVRKRNRLTILLFFVGLFLLLALRDFSVGTDLYTYKMISNACYSTPFSKLPTLQWELGYTTYTKLLSFITEDYRFLLIVTALLTLIPIYKLYVKEERYSFFLIVIFINMPCFLLIFSGLRQALAISIGIFAYMAMEKKKYLMAALFILLAMYFHISALILVLLYPAFFLKIRTIHLLYVVPIMLIIYLFRVPMLTFLIEYLPEHYLEFYGEVEQTGAFGMMILFMIFTVFAFVILDEAVMSQKDYFMRNILLIATIFQFFVPIHGLVQRASYYFLIFIPIALLCIVRAPKRKLKNISDIALVVMTCFFTVYFFYHAVYSTDNLLEVFPYKFFWSGFGW